jgi:hypothetical protein
MKYIDTFGGFLALNEAKLSESQYERLYSKLLDKLNINTRKVFSMG